LGNARADAAVGAALAAGDRRHHTARVYIDKPPGVQRPAAG
jgi:hypothetical protein